MSSLIISSAATWTYADDPGASSLDAVRFLIGDVDVNDPLLQNAEITWAIKQEENLYLTAADLLDVLANRYTRLAQSESNGDVSRSYGDRAAGYATRATALRARATRGGHAPMAYAGGLSQAEMQDLAQNDDAVRPYFTAGINDHRGESVSSGYGLQER